MKGPDATAGFIPNLSNNKGVTVPINDANTTTENKAKLTVEDKFISSPAINHVLRKTKAAIISPLSTPVKVDLRQVVNIFLLTDESSAKSCTTIEDDWIPTFPPVAVIKGIKKARAGIIVSSFSKRLINLAPNKPPPIPINNHGIRALTKSKKLESY